MTAYVLRRLTLSMLLIVLVATAIFSMVRVVPGDVVDAMLADAGATREQVAAMRQAIGLDQPVLAQYVTWVSGLTRGDLGKSLVTGRDIGADIAQTFPRTLELILGATVLAWLIGIPAGVTAASRNNSVVDVLISSAALVGFSVPAFVRGTLLILFFAVQLGWLPSSGFAQFSQNPAEHLRLLILPVLAIGIAFGGSVMRMTKGSLLDVLRHEYVRTAWAKGLGGRRVLYGHALRNSLIPVVTASGIQIGELLGGTVVIEYVFNYPGMSTMLINAVQRRDYTVVQATVLVISTTFILINLAIDLINAYLDPRVRYA